MYIFRLSYIYFFTQNSVSNLVKRTILKIDKNVGNYDRESVT